MRIAATIIVIIGVLATLSLGSIWVSDYVNSTDEIKLAENMSESLGLDVKSELQEVEKMKNSGISMIAGSILAFISIILIGKLKKIGSVVILLAAIVPAVFYPGSLLFSFMLILGGILSFFIKPKVKEVPTGDAAQV